VNLPLRRARLAGNAGMTLIEVIVAISIMGIVATAAIGLSITSQTSAAAQQRQELAVTIANQAMEQISAQAAGTNLITNKSYLFQGRTQSLVNASWSANAGAAGLADTYPGWDTAAVATSTPVVPMSSTIRQSGTDYTTHTLIGTCYQATSGSGNCVRLAPAPARPPATAPASTTQLVRLIVIVRWTAGTGCAASGCSYQATSFVDAHFDLQWKTNG